MLKKSCKHCGRIHPRGHACRHKPKAARPEGSRRQDSFRGSKAWQAKREEVRRRDMHMCRACLDRGVVNARGLEVHHIVPIRHDYARRLDGGNLITLCGWCHGQAESGGLTRRRLEQMAREQICGGQEGQGQPTPGP